MILNYYHDDVVIQPFEYHSAIILTKDKNCLYACTTEGNYAVSKYIKNKESKMWELNKELPRSETDDVEAMMQLKLDKEEKVLFGKNILLHFSI